MCRSLTDNRALQISQNNLKISFFTIFETYWFSAGLERWRNVFNISPSARDEILRKIGHSCPRVCTDIRSHFIKRHSAKLNISILFALMLEPSVSADHALSLYLL